MISRLFQQQKLSKSQRKKFVPFVNERDFMGTLIQQKNKLPSDRTAKNNMSNNLAIIQNLKKTTKEYFFDKKYSKLKEKLKRMQESFHPKQHNYDEEVDQCIKTIYNNSAFFSKKNDENQYYVDLNQELSEKINFIKTDILGRIGTSKSEKKRKNKQQLKSLSQQFQQKQLRITKQATQKKENIEGQKNKKISKEIFASLGNRSEYMTDFTNAGLKYRQFVQTRKLNPWKKWYAQQQLQLFPGQKIKMKRLQKTIY